MKNASLALPQSQKSQMRETETNDSRTPLQHPSDEQDTTKETDAGHEAKDKRKNDDNKKHHNSTNTNAPHQESGNMFLGDIKYRHT